MAEKPKRGLGSGLGALFGEDVLAEKGEKELTLPISKVEPRADQPRYSFDEEALETLSESIRQYGLIQPITVRKLDGGFYQIIAGERRWRAARMAGLSEVPVRIIEADDKRAIAPLMDDSVNEIFAEIAHYHPGSHVISTNDNDENGYRFAVRIPPNFPSANKDKLPHCIESYITDRTLQSWYTVIRPEEATVIATRTQNDAVTLQTLLTQREKPARTV